MQKERRCLIVGLLTAVLAPGVTACGDQDTGANVYVKIEDLSSGAGSPDEVDGADIDAVELVKAGVSSWAASVESCTLGGGGDCTGASWAANKADKATGAKDAFCGNIAVKCVTNIEGPGGADDPGTEPAYVSLGGAGGALILSMSETIEDGDKLIVYELGGCDIVTTRDSCGDDATDVATPDSIKISVAESASGPWMDLLPASSHTLPTIEIDVALQ